jgi:hypothetical protein
MRNLLYKGLLLLLAIMLIKQLANLISPAYDKRDLDITYKTDQLMEAGVNTLFLGTSRIKRGIIPAVIDSICPGLNTYNFGENHFAFPYSCKWVEDHLANLPDLKVLAIELTGVGEKILDLKTWLPYATTCLDPTNGWDYEQKIFATLRECIIEDYLSPLPNINSFLQGRHLPKKGAGMDGDFSVPSDVLTSKEHNLSLVQTNKLTQGAVALQNTDDSKALAAPSAYRSSIDRLMQQCEAANVQLVLLVPPLFSEEQEVDVYQRLISYVVLKGIPLLSIDHPSLYEGSHRYDYRHFNQRGARLYSEEVGKALKEVLR